MEKCRNLIETINPIVMKVLLCNGNRDFPNERVYSLNMFSYTLGDIQFLGHRLVTYFGRDIWF